MIPVAVIQREDEHPDLKESRDALDIRWHHFLRACGLLAVPMPNDPELALIQAVALRCRGLVLTGGGDLEREGKTPDRREKTERALYAWAREANLPVIGVCRGMQFLITVAGGTLDEVEGHLVSRHPVELQTGERMVNSFHRFAALTVPPGFEVIARAGAVVEAIRHHEMPVLGMMWHPERDHPFDPTDVAMIRSLFWPTTLRSFF